MSERIVRPSVRPCVGRVGLQYEQKALKQKGIYNMIEEARKTSPNNDCARVSGS